MDQLLIAYIDCHYTEEIRDELYDCINVLIDYSYPDIDLNCVNFILKEQYEQKEQIEDDVYQDIFSKIKSTVEQQGIFLNENTSLGVFLEVAKALRLIQSLDDYVPISICLNTLTFDDEKIIGILTEYSQLSEIQLRDVYIGADPRFLPILKKFVDEKLGNGEEVLTVDPEIILNAKLFSRIDEKALGVQLAKDGALLGQPIELYMAYLKEHLNELSDEKFALHFYSVTLISQSFKENPIEIYRELFEEYISDQMKLILVEKQILSVVSKFMEIVKEHHEKSRLP